MGMEHIKRSISTV